MEIQYLQMLRDNPTINGFTNRGISLTEIAHLEALYNNNTPFPKVLKEMLFLAGDYCGVLDRGYSGGGGQEAIQNKARLKFQNGYNITISRPHYFIDFADPDYPVFIFFDEGDNPPVYQIDDDTPGSYYGDMGGSLQAFINSGIENYLRGLSPI